MAAAPSSAGQLLRRWFGAMFAAAESMNYRHIAEMAWKALSSLDEPLVCDLGGGNGRLLEEIAARCQRARGYVIDGGAQGLQEAQRRGLHGILADLNRPLPVTSNVFDVVVANQVIEHLYDTDQFLAEAVRIAKPGGGVIVSTENPASWHNIAALVAGWQPFSSTNVSGKRAGIGNPLAIWAGGEGAAFAMQHHRLLSLAALTELYVLHGLKCCEARGAGYYPLPALVGGLDPRHAHFITLCGQKSRGLRS